ncbi:EAL domain-containing protein [Glaciecola sp. SC05]|uniref:two-component system response regulator n=1 Tax=Glaciecola sp. SC05 TaxID=1987355 RepID=UPI003529C792
MTDNLLHSQTILTVDDDPTNINAVAGFLQPLGAKLMVANSGASALAALERNIPDIIILDINMPEQSGIDVCRIIKKDHRFKHIPVLFLTASGTDISEAFDAGGVDYVKKPVRSEELIARLSTHIRISQLMQSLDKANLLLEGVNESLEIKVRDRTLELVTVNKNLRLEIDERRRLQDQLTYLSNYDFVTRMFNRNSMEQELKSVMENQDDNNTRWFLYFIDLDQFKIINDTCGHIAGDELLRQIAELMRHSLDFTCICSRMGGDEFAVLSQTTSLDAAIKRAHEIKDNIENHKFEWNDETFRHTISMAVVEIDEGIDSVSHLLSIAERTCFESKRKGGGEISIYNYSKAYIDKTQQQMKVIPLIHQALDENQFVLYFQHIHTNGTQDTKKIEILLRLKDKSGKVKPPGHFIPVAERFHLITEIDKWVLKNTFMVMKDLPDDIIVSINLSGEFIIKSNAVMLIRSLIEEYKVSPERLCFEITETSAIAKIEATHDLMLELSKIGCLFSLDDFGTGTSSYEYLKQLPVDFVKIDGMFVRDIENDEINRKMVESIAGIARAKQIKVIAECVETDAALEIIRGMDVDYYQGYVSHRPEPLSKLKINLD